ncbi:MAG: chorismate synthase [Peptococcaceae bacterium]|jgi:chorismate synthase|nr:chorismate synthase [Peptococcaceae bacterium]
MRFLTAGESHGPKLTGIIEGLPAGMPIDKQKIDETLRRRQRGPGRGGRMKIEADEIVFTAGIRAGKTTGAPVALEIINRDFPNWETVMTWQEQADVESRKVVAPRPGHADLTGALKYRMEIRNVLERASARETAMRVAIGAIARQLLESVGMEVRGRVTALGGVHARLEESEAYWQAVSASPWLCGDTQAEQAWEARLTEARQSGESLGGVLEVQILHVPAGIGSYVQWDRKLDGRLAQAVLSVQAMKGVSFGLGFEAAHEVGSRVHDPIDYQEGTGFFRSRNHAGGIEGGMSNGEPLIIHAAMKPIPTLYQPLPTVRMDTKEQTAASVERSDICAAPAALIVVEHVTAWVVAEMMLEKFSADSFSEFQQAVHTYREYLKTV